MRKKTAKLALSKKTISNLDGQEMNRHAGGGATNGNCTVKNCQGVTDTSCTCANSNWPWTCQGHTCQGNKCA